MDAGGFNWLMMTGIGAIILFAVILFATIRNRSAESIGKPPRSRRTACTRRRTPHTAAKTIAFLDLRKAEAEPHGQAC